MTFQKIEDSMKSEERVESQKQRNAVKPIVVSRRRLLRAGAASVPVILTMAARTPLYAQTGQWSGASGLNYDGHGVAARFWNYNDNGIVHSDTNGIIFDPVNNSLVCKHQRYDNTFYVEITTNDDPVKVAVFKVTATANINMYQHKNGYWYMRNSTVVLNPSDTDKASNDLWMSTNIEYYSGENSVASPTINWATPSLSISPASDSNRTSEGNPFVYSFKTSGGSSIKITVAPTISTETGYSSTWTDDGGNATTAPTAVEFGPTSYKIPNPVNPANF